MANTFNIEKMLRKKRQNKKRSSIRKSTIDSIKESTKKIGKHLRSKKKDSSAIIVLKTTIIVLLVAGIFFFGWMVFFGSAPFEQRTYENYTVSDDPYLQKRTQMVELQLQNRDITDERLLDAMRKVPRHMFMPHSHHLAYGDHPVPIGYGQTISQPYIVALMIQELGLKGDEIVLEIGAGSGYNAAVLAEVSREVYTIEIIEQLAGWAESALDRTGYTNVYVKHADGYYGWPGKEFDAIIITAAANHVPQPLLDQLKIDGRLILPLSSPAGFQALTLITKTEEGLQTRVITGVVFVPMTGRMLE